MEPIWIILKKSGSAIRIWNEPYKDQERILSLQFRLFDVAQEMDGNWTLVSSGSEFHSLTEWEGASWDADGFIKWDGCINWRTDPKCMIHGCGPEHIVEISDFLTVVYHLTKELIPSFDIDEVPDLPTQALRLT